MYAKNKEWYSGSSSSSAGEEWRPQGQKEEIKKLRAQVELLSEQQGAGKSLEEPSELAWRGSDLDEGCWMEVEEEVQSQNKLDEDIRNLQRQMRDIGKITFCGACGQRSPKREVEVSVARSRKEKDGLSA